MPADFQDALHAALGDVEGLQIHEMALRAVLIYVAALIMVRWGEKRFLGKSTAFDVLLAIILGSVVSRAITGQSPLLATLIDPAKVKEARLERNGDISVIPAESEPRIVRAALIGRELTVTVALRG